MGERHIGDAVRRVAQQVAAADLNAVWGRVQNDPVDEVALRELVDRWGPGFLGYCGAALGDGHAAEDVVSAAFATLIRRRAVPPDAGAALQYLWKTVARAARRARWQVARRPDRTSLCRATETADPRDSDDPSARAERAEVVADVSAAMRKLSPNEQCAVGLVAFLGQTEGEAAGVMGCGRSSVSTYLARAREKLGRLLVRWKDSVAAIGGVATVDTVLTSAARAGSIPPAMVESILRRAAVPVFSVSTWAKASVVLLALATVGGIAVAVWPAAAPEMPPVAAFRPTPIGPTETLQEKNRRILLDEVLPRLLDEIRRTMPADNQVSVTAVRAFGSEVEVELRPVRMIPHFFPAGLRLRYCVARRVLNGTADVYGTGKWVGVDPARPIVSEVPNPLLPFLTMTVVTGQDRWAATRLTFDLLPTDNRAETELLRMLFGPPGGELVLPSGFRVVMGTAGRLYVWAGDNMLYYRTERGWRCWGEWPMGHQAVEGNRLYRIGNHAIWSHSADSPPGKWEPWGSLPMPNPEQGGVYSFYVDGGQFMLTAHDQVPLVWLWSGPVANPQAKWQQTAFLVNPRGVVPVGGQLFSRGGPGDQWLVTCQAANPAGTWNSICPLPQGADLLVAYGDQLLAMANTPGKIYARPVEAAPDVPWVEVGRVHDPYKR